MEHLKIINMLTDEMKQDQRIDGEQVSHQPVHPGKKALCTI
jgi:hypothetical protein